MFQIFMSILQNTSIHFLYCLIIIFSTVKYSRKLKLIDEKLKKLADIDRSVVPSMVLYILKKKRSKNAADNDKYVFKYSIKLNPFITFGRNNL